MNDEQQEKRKLWKVYGIFMGIMVGGAVLILGGQAAWNALQRNLAKSTVSTPNPSTEATKIESNSQVNTSTPSSPSSSPVSSQSKPDPQEFLRQHYSLINQGDYQTTWNALSASFKSRKNIDYSIYTDWWDSVSQVNLDDVKLLNNESQSAFLSVQMTYYMKGGDIYSEGLYISLIWDARSEKWAIDNTERQ
jgi:serine/threonine-protein kinase